MSISRGSTVPWKLRWEIVSESGYYIPNTANDESMEVSREAAQPLTQARKPSRWTEGTILQNRRRIELPLLQ